MFWPYYLFPALLLGNGLPPLLPTVCAWPAALCALRGRAVIHFAAPFFFHCTARSRWGSAAVVHADWSNGESSSSAAGDERLDGLRVCCAAGHGASRRGLLAPHPRLILGTRPQSFGAPRHTRACACSSRPRCTERDLQSYVVLPLHEQALVSVSGTRVDAAPRGWRRPGLREALCWGIGTRLCPGRALGPGSGTEPDCSPGGDFGVRLVTNIGLGKRG